MFMNEEKIEELEIRVKWLEDNLETLVDALIILIKKTEKEDI